MAYLRMPLRPLEDTSPALPISVSSTGNWKHTPKARMKLVVSARYCSIEP